MKNSQELRRLSEITIGHYDNVADDYWHGTQNHDVSQNYEAFLEAIEGKPPYDILDLGCGGGLVCEPLARLGASVTGIDFVSQNINVAKKHARESKLKIRYSQMDIKKISLKEKYDLILMFEILEHLDDWKNLIKKMKSLLKPKGILIVSTINRTLLAQILAIFVAENILNWVPKNTHNFKKLIKPEELIYHLKKNKFKVIDLTGLVFKPISAEWRLDKKNTKINYFCTGVRSN